MRFYRGLLSDLTFCFIDFLSTNDNKNDKTTTKILPTSSLTSVKKLKSSTLIVNDPVTESTRCKYLKMTLIYFLINIPDLTVLDSSMHVNPNGKKV